MTSLHCSFWGIVYKLMTYYIVEQWFMSCWIIFGIFFNRFLLVVCGVWSPENCHVTNFISTKNKVTRNGGIFSFKKLVWMQLKCNCGILFQPKNLQQKFCHSARVFLFRAFYSSNITYSQVCERPIRCTLIWDERRIWFRFTAFKNIKSKKKES